MLRILAENSPGFKHAELRKNDWETLLDIAVYSQDGF
jgi:hypothetical protein